MVLRFLLLALPFLLVACATAESLVEQGKMFAKDKKYEEALAFYEKAIAVEPNNTSALYNAGVACAKLARNDKAIEYFQKTISSGDRDNYSHSQDARYNIASIRLSQGQYQEAIKVAMWYRPQTDDIIQKAWAKLKETGFPYAPDVQTVNPITIPYPTDQSLLNGADMSQEKIRTVVVAAIDDKGKVFLTKCYGVALCEYAASHIKNNSFVPSYDSWGKAPASSVTYFKVVWEPNSPASITWQTIAGMTDTEPSEKISQTFILPLTEVQLAAGFLMTPYRHIIHETIKYHIDKIRWCYEKELGKDKELAGNISLNFTISGTGEVSSIETQESTMNNISVEACVKAQIGNMLLPTPEDNGVVIVASYPFVFKHAD